MNCIFYFKNKNTKEKTKQNKNCFGICVVFIYFLSLYNGQTIYIIKPYTNTNIIISFISLALNIHFYLFLINIVQIVHLNLFYLTSCATLKSPVSSLLTKNDKFVDCILLPRLVCKICGSWQNAKIIFF